MRTLAKSIIIYKSVKLPDPITLAHSRLYCLEPVGLGTSFVESLTGYIVRLAEAHCISVTTLSLKEIMPMISKTKSSQNDENRQFYNFNNRNNLYRAIPTINGMGIVAEDWVQSVESLTLQKNIRSLSLLTWRNVISSYSLLRSERAWCSFCYRDQKISGRIVYEQLLWTLKAVTVCNIHCCPLSVTCPHCHKTLPILNLRSRPGYCGLCQKWLGASDEYIRAHQSKSGNDNLSNSLQIAYFIGELLAITQNIKAPLKREFIAQSINVCIDNYSYGNIATFAKQFGLTEIVVTRLLQGKALPRVTTLLRICLPQNISLLKLLQGEITFSNDASNSKNKKPYWEGGKRPNGYRNYVEEQRVLTLALNENPHPPLSTVARRLDYKSSGGNIYRAHPLLCRQITARYKLFMTERTRSAKRLGSKQVICRKEYVHHTKESVLKELQNALIETPLPSLSLLAKRCGFEVRRFKRNYPDFCNKLLQYQVEFETKQMQTKRLILEAALSEEPIPSLQEMAKRIGHGSNRYIAKHFPDIHHKVTKNRMEMRRQTLNDIQKKLEQALKETPAKSLKEISHKVDYDVSYLYQKYPILCYKIADRYKVYKSEISEQKKAALYKRMKKTAIKLQHQGLDLTAWQIGKKLKSHNIRGFIKSKIFKENYQTLKTELHLTL